MDGTLLGDDGHVSPRNHAALRAAQAAGIEVVVATGRRHSYAMRVLRPLGLPHASVLVSSNGTVTRTLGAPADPSQLIARTYLPHATALWLCSHVDEFRNALVLTFDRVGPNGDDTRGALVVEHLDELTSSIGRWMAANEPYIARIVPIEGALTGADGDAPIQAMLCGTVERMARAEARLLEHPGVSASGHPSGRSGKTMGAPGLAPETWESSHKSPGAPSFATPPTLGTPSFAASSQRVGCLPSSGHDDETAPGALSSPTPPTLGAPSFAASSQRVGCLPSSGHDDETAPGAPSSPAPQTLGAPSFPRSSQRVGCLPSSGHDDETAPILTLNRTEYPDRDLSILDILPAGCSKGAAILSLAATRGIAPAQILAIGDNWNDVSMLEIAGSAVLMDNAPEDLKALARTRGWRIGRSNSNDGVADAIEAALSVPC
jgi:hydroxymethylpyrimidine pyrophosphatase-like HAD family hydrolase